MKAISKIYDISDEEIMKKADEYVKMLGENLSEADKEKAKEFYIENSKRHLTKMKTVSSVKFKQQQRRRELSKKNRKMALRNKRRGK